MTRLAEESGAINLAQGMPDFEASSRVKGAATKAIMEDFNQYETTWGSARTDITVTCGSTEAMTASIIATVDVGDEVIIPEPFYEYYVPATIIAGATPKHVKLRENGQAFDEEELKSAFSSRTKAIIVNTPNNPSGKVLTTNELKLVADLCADFDAIAVTDEIYEHIVYDGRKHISMASLDGMGDRTITISGLSKTYSVTGWRVGYAIAAKEITNAIRKVHDYTTVCAPTPFQKAGIEALKLPKKYYSRLAKEYQRRRDFVVRSLQNLGFRAASPEGAYYILADFSSISAADDTNFARNLTRNAKVAAVPGSSFYAHREMGRSKVRFSFAKRDQTLREAMKRLNRFAFK